MFSKEDIEVISELCTYALVANNLLRINQSEEASILIHNRLTSWLEVLQGPNSHAKTPVLRS